jgi:hypothetical protein
MTTTRYKHNMAAAQNMVQTLLGTDNGTRARRRKQYMAPEWRRDLRHCIAVLEVSLQNLIRSWAVSQLAVIGSPIGWHTIGQALGEVLAGGKNIYILKSSSNQIMCRPYSEMLS